ncbi:hypothetical protein ABZ864_44935 [Streptomyces sp. NPDC047082]|uniref:hypothetical protein n=1 Tax=Streptomyces sp. NPDC047082 TaxID=3155259 RepID=UPI0033E5282F
MTTASGIPKAKERKRRIRTKKTSSLPAVLLSSLPAIHVNLLAGEESLICPSCETWCPITGPTSTAPKLVPHHRGRAGTSEPHRCVGSLRRVEIDVDVADWGREVAAAEATATGRRSSRVNRKPLASVPTPVHRMASVPGPSARLLAEQARARAGVDRHRSDCSTCRTGQARCPVGRQLEIRLLHTDASVRLAHEQHESALRAAAAPAIPRAQQWRQVKDHVSRANQQRRKMPAGQAPLGSPPVPLTTLRPQRPTR